MTVGAYTNKKLIEQVGYDDWNPIAQQDSLSPCSRTSKSWSDKTWPIKPDIVMEGGNSAIDPATKKADSVDDLSLLTTKLSATGALFTTTGDTSGAAALASRFAARIWASYPTLWPETIRGLLVHSARWTSSMLQEFPYLQRHDRLRVYGYGVPNFQKAMSSANHEATQIIEGELRPFELVSGRCKTKDMHLHSLPWPKEVLESLGEARRFENMLGLNLQIRTQIRARLFRLGQRRRLFHDYLVANSANRHKPFANLMCSVELQDGSSNFGDATTIERHFARLLATFILFELWRKFIPLSASAAVEQVIE